MGLLVLAPTTCMLEAIGILPLLYLPVGLHLQSGIRHSGFLPDHWGHQQGPQVFFWGSVGTRFRRVDRSRGSSSCPPPPLKTSVSLGSPLLETPLEVAPPLGRDP